MNPIADLHVISHAFELDNTLRTVVTISLLSYARARAGDPVLPGAYTHGWWGDAYAEVENDSWGSRLWTLAGLSPSEIAAAAPALAKDALQWLIDDGLATAVDVTVQAIDGNVALTVEIS